MSDFNGRTITGDINHYTGQPAPQRDPQEFLDAVDKVLAVPGVEAVRWEQYTPYFNDGEACVFSAGYSPSVKLTGATTEDDYGDETEFLTEYDLFSYDTSDGGFKRVFNEIPGVDVKQVHEALEDFERVLTSGSHDVILNKKFGDPAQVTATPDGFSVEYYEHD